MDTSVILRTEEAGFFFPGGSTKRARLIYVVSGSIHCICGGVHSRICQGGLVLHAPNQWHMHYADIGTAPTLLTLETESDACPSAIFSPLPPQARSTAEKILEELQQSDDFSKEMTALLTKQLLVLLRRAGIPAAAAPHKEQQLLCRAQKVICAHARQRLNVPLAAEMTGVSPSYLTALFHKHFSISPGEYIRRVKLQASKEMIREGALNFTQIAQALEYSTVHQFSRQFKEKFGITPTEYAKSVR